MIVSCLFELLLASLVEVVLEELRLVRVISGEPSNRQSIVVPFKKGFQIFDFVVERELVEVLGGREQVVGLEVAFYEGGSNLVLFGAAIRQLEVVELEELDEENQGVLAEVVVADLVESSVGLDDVLDALIDQEHASVLGFQNLHYAKQQKFIMVLVLFLWIVQTMQQCLEREFQNSQFFLQPSENISLPLMDYFIGQNLTFESDAVTVYNAAAVLAAEDTNSSIVSGTVYESQFTKEWLGFSAELGLQSNVWVVNVYSIVGRQIKPYFSQFLPQLQYQLTCSDLAFIDQNNIIVDCYYLNSQIIYNLFYVVQKDSQIVQIIPNTNFSSAQNVTFRQLQVAANSNRTPYLFRALYNQQILGKLEVFEASLPSSPIQTFDTYSMRGFQIYNQSLYILNQTSVVAQYSINNFTQLLNLFQISPLLPDSVQFLAFDVLPENQQIILYTSALENNLLILSPSAIVTQFTARITSSLAYPPKIINNLELVAIDVNSAVYIYSKKIPFTLMSILNQNLISLNQSPFVIHTYSTQTISLSLINEPFALGSFKQSTIFQIAATSANSFGTATCKKTFNVTVLNANTSLEVLQKNFNFPETAIANAQYTQFSVNYFASGPLLNFTASTNTSTEVQNPSVQQNLSMVVWQHIGGLDSFYSTQYASYSQIVIEQELTKGSAIKYSNITLRICDIPIDEFAVQINNLSCTQYKDILSVNAPINKLEFSDVSSTNTVYAVLNIATSAVVIYQITNFNSITKVNGTFLCEPIPVDEFSYQHTFSSFSVVGQNLYIVLNDVNEVWIYDIPTCKKISEITTREMGQYFQPQSVTGSYNFELASTSGQLLFIDSIYAIYMVELLNNTVPVLQNIIQIPVNSSQNVVEIVDEYIAIIAFDGANYHIQTLQYSNLQPWLSPIPIAFLPLYGIALSPAMLTASDSQFLYVQMSNGYYFVYNPALPSHDSLVYALPDIGNFITPISIPNRSKQSIIMTSDNYDIITYAITSQKLIQIGFQPVNVTQYVFGVNYSVFFYSMIADGNFTVQDQITVYDTLIEGQVNDTLFNQTNLQGKFTTVNSQGVQELNTTNILQNNIISYSLSNTYDLKFKLQQYFYNQTGYCIVNKISQIVSFGLNNQAIFQNLTGLYLYNGNTPICNLKSLLNFSSVLSQCHILTQENSAGQILSICSYYYEYFVTVYQVQNSSNTSFTLNSTIYQPTKGVLINTTLLVLAVSNFSSFYEIQVLQMGSSSLQYIFAIGCGQGYESDVNDFQAYALNSTNILIVYTCPYLKQVQSAILQYSQNSFTVVNQTSFSFDISLPRKALLQELVYVSGSKTKFNFVLTTRDFYSLLIDFEQSNSTITVLSYISPIQNCTLLKGSQYVNGNLVQRYENARSNESFVALYQLSQSQGKIVYSVNSLQLAGTSKFALTQSQNYMVLNYEKALYQFTIGDALYLTYTSLVDGTSYPMSLLLTQGFGPQQTVPINLQFGELNDQILTWWAWVLIGLGSLAVVIGLGFGIKHCTTKKKEESEEEKEQQQALIVERTLEMNASTRQKPFRN